MPAYAVKLLNVGKMERFNIMNQKERDAQRALGNLEEFQVTVTIPLILKVRVIHNVMAVNGDDALEKVYMLQDIKPQNDQIREAVAKVGMGGAKAKFDDSIERKYDVRQLTLPKSAEEINVPSHISSPHDADCCSGDCSSP